MIRWDLASVIVNWRLKLDLIFYSHDAPIAMPQDEIRTRQDRRSPTEFWSYDGIRGLMPARTGSRVFCIYFVVRSDQALECGHRLLALFSY